MLQNYKIYNHPLSSLPEGNLLINTINAHSYNVSRSDAAFAQALHASDVLLPDGVSVSVVWAVRWLGRAKSQESRAKTEDRGRKTGDWGVEEDCGGGFVLLRDETIRQTTP